MNTVHSPISYDSQHRRAMSVASSRQSSCYPASPSMEPHTAAQAHGLGLQYTMAPPSSTVSPTHMASPAPEWPAVSHAVAPAYSTSQAPDIFSAAFDPFSGFTTSNTTGMVASAGGHSPEAPGLEFCATPPSSNLASHRGSVSSYPASDAGSNGAYTPRAKHEDAAGEWYVGGQAAVAYPPHATEQLYREASSEALYRPQPEGYLADLSGKGFDGMTPLSATRMRKRRQRTTPEEATHECRVCGKLFKRSYNWKSHMETHNPDRKYPHPCPHSVGNSPCSKKFQRKTDLDRHVDSVHLKSRNHKCTLCGNRFARRDTLRRHSEDGCPKRFELNLREGSAPAAPIPEAAPAAAARWSFSAAPGPVGFAPRMPPHALPYGGFHPQAVYSQ